MWAWMGGILIGLGVGLLGGYFLGVWCARISEMHLQQRNSQLYWTLRALIEAADPLHDDTRLGQMIETARKILKEPGP